MGCFELGDEEVEDEFVDFVLVELSVVLWDGVAYASCLYDVPCFCRHFACGDASAEFVTDEQDDGRLFSYVPPNAMVHGFTFFDEIIASRSWEDVEFAV